jgi:hypothetical protein
VSSPTASKSLQVNVAAEADVGVLVCVYMRGTEYGAGLEGWKKVANATDLHGAYGDPLATNKVNESFTVEAKHEASYGYAIRPDSSWDASHVVAVVLTPKKGDAKVSIGLNKPATAAPAPAPAPAQDGLIGVDRGSFFSTQAAAQMEFWNVHKDEAAAPNRAPLNVPSSNSKCLAAVKRTLSDTSALISDDQDDTRFAKNFAAVMRDRTKVRGYRELLPSEVTFANAKPDEKTRWSYHRLPALKNRLPVGSIIVYENHDPSDSGVSYEIGHIDMVADYHGRKSLMSDHIAKWGDGWSFLENKSKERNVTLSIFVPTEANRVMRIKPLDLSDHSKGPKTGGPAPKLPPKKLPPRRGPLGSLND